MIFITPAYADTTAKLAAGFDIMSFLPIILIFAVFYFLILRPQQLKAKKHQQVLSNLKKGDRIITSGGIIATIHKIINTQEVMLELDENVKVRLVRSAITEVLSKNSATEVDVTAKKPA